MGNSSKKTNLFFIFRNILDYQSKINVRSNMVKRKKNSEQKLHTRQKNYNQATTVLENYGVNLGVN